MRGILTVGTVPLADDNGARNVGLNGISANVGTPIMGRPSGVGMRINGVAVSDAFSGFLSCATAAVAMCLPCVNFGRLSASRMLGSSLDVSCVFGTMLNAYVTIVGEKGSVVAYFRNRYKVSIPLASAGEGRLRDDLLIGTVNNIASLTANGIVNTV